MEKQEIEITIRPGGRIEYTIKGVKGSACESISALLEQLGKVQEDLRTGEYYEQGTDAQIHISQA